MRIYVAASFERRVEVNSIQRQFRQRGHTIIDWTHHKVVADKPETEQDRLRIEYAQEDYDGVVGADIFVLLPGEHPTIGAHVELGIALGAKVPQIYVIPEGKTSVFHLHPRIKRVKNIQAVIEQIGVKKA